MAPRSPRIHRLQALLAGGSAARRPIGLGENDLAAQLHASATARPKGVMMTHRNPLPQLHHTWASLEDTILHTLPMFHANGWGGPFAITAMGGRHVVLRKIDGQAIFELIAAEGVTIACMAPAVLATILNYPDKANHTLRTKPRLIVADELLRGLGG
jgi:fatty-acyl-CoA synthase